MPPSDDRIDIGGREFTIEKEGPGLLESFFGGESKTVLKDGDGNTVARVEVERPGPLGSFLGKETERHIVDSSGERLGTFAREEPGLIDSLLGRVGRDVVKDTSGNTVAKFESTGPSFPGSLFGAKPTTILTGDDGKKIASFARKEPGLIGWLLGEGPKRSIRFEAQTRTGSESPGAAGSGSYESSAGGSASHGSSSRSTNASGPAIAVLLIGGLGLGYVFLSSLALPRRTTTDVQGRVAYVTAEQLRLRSGPGLSHAAIATLPRATEVTCYDRFTEPDGTVWVHVRRGNDDGWMSEKYLSPVRPTSASSDDRANLPGPAERPRNARDQQRIGPDADNALRTPDSSTEPATAHSISPDVGPVDGAPIDEDRPVARRSPDAEPLHPALAPPRAPIHLTNAALMAKAVTRATPAYPGQARSLRIAGTVVVEIVVDESGHVVSADCRQGNTLLRNAALDAIRKWTFAPTYQNGVPVRVTGTVTFSFTLS